MYSVCILIYGSMHQYNYPSTHGIPGLPAGGAWEHVEVGLKMTIESTERYTPRLWFSKFGAALGEHDQDSLEMHLEARIKWTQWYTPRPWLSECGNALGRRDWVNWGMHLEAVIERVWTCNWKVRLSKLRDALQSHNRARLDMHVAAMIVWVSRCTCRQWLSEIGGVLLEVVDLEAVNGRCVRCWDTIHWLVNSTLSECDKVLWPSKGIWRTGW